MEKVNGAVQRIGFKIPELWDENFLSSLVQAGASEPSPKVGSNSAAVAQLKTDLLDLAKMSAQERGYAFERFLNHLFEAFQMTPRTPFRNRGEQIDGSFADERDYYLLEAKWQAEKVGVADLRSFLGAVESKAEWSRGCFVSYSGFSEDGLYAFGKGRSTRIICIDATDLWHVVDGKVDLRELIRKKIRHAAEHGEAFVPARDLFTNII
ncbi:MAG TPA: restriction endonuclease [Xanthobacteraceae bacterium]|nr:restriction endonuclease [Xanthobacteraceae bacterium]